VIAFWTPGDPNPAFGFWPEMKLAVNTLAFCVAALLALGMVMLYSSSMTQVGARYLIMQSIWCVLGLAACVIAAVLDYRLLKRFAWPAFIFAVVMLALVLENIGVVRGMRDLVQFRRVVFHPRIRELALITIWPGRDVTGARCIHRCAALSCPVCSSCRCC
jgi:tellurite resistance protein TehA-like permease